MTDYQPQPDTSISHGTLRTQDLIPTMLEELRRIGAVEYDQLMALPFGPIPAHAQEDDAAEWWDEEDAYWRMQGLFDVLELYAPEGCYFGMHPGDGSDLGYWRMDDER